MNEQTVVITTVASGGDHVRRNEAKGHPVNPENPYVAQWLETTRSYMSAFRVAARALAGRSGSGDEQASGLYRPLIRARNDWYVLKEFDLEPVANHAGHGGQQPDANARVVGRSNAVSESRICQPWPKRGANTMQRYGVHISSEEDIAIVSAVRNYIDKEVMPLRMALDDDHDAVRRAYGGLVELGIQKRGFSQRHGGLGIRSATTVCAITEEISRGDSGLALHTLIVPWAMGAAMGAQNNVVLDKYAPMFCGDEPRCACLAITEPAGGCNVEDEAAHGRTIRTTARLEGDEWVINGEKMWPSGASVSDMYCVVCQTDSHQGEDGVALIYVPKDTPGMTFGKPENKMGMRITDVNAAIYFNDVRVPKSYRAAGPGVDWKLFRHAVSWGRLSSAPMALGNAQAVLEIVIEYAATRFYGGKSVRNHSLQAAMIAEMAIGIESARAHYMSVAAMFNDRKRFGSPGDDFLLGRTSASKVHACNVAEMVCNRAMELMGSYGYTRDYHVEKYLRDFKIVQLWLGGPQLAKLDVAQSYYPYRSKPSATA